LLEILGHCTRREQQLLKEAENKNIINKIADSNNLI